MNDIREVIVKAAVGIGASGGSLAVSRIDAVEAWLRVLSLLGGFLVSVAALVSIVLTIIWKMRRNKSGNPRRPKLSDDDTGYYTLLVLSFTIFVGCQSVVPTKRTESIKATENIATAQNLMIETVTKSRPMSTNAVFEETMRVTHTADQKAGANEDAKMAISMPLAVGLLMSAVALLIVGIALWAIRNSSATGRAADEGIAQTIRGARTVISGITDTSAKSQLNELIAQAEATRGKLKK